MYRSWMLKLNSHELLGTVSEYAIIALRRITEHPTWTLFMYA